jgi:hypothetical protein
MTRSNVAELLNSTNFSQEVTLKVGLEHLEQIVLLR